MLVLRHDSSLALRMTRSAKKAAPRVRATDLLIYAVLVLAGIAFVLPFYWMIVSSFRPTAQFYQLPIPLVPNPPSLENFETLFARSKFGRGILNSAFLAVVSVILQVWFCALAGYTFAKLRFRGRDALFVGILTTMMIPLGVGLIPNFIIMARIGWVDTYRALIVPGIANAFGIFWMRQYCLSVPDELLDAARVDGAGEFGIFSRIVLPVIRPALASLAIFVFLSSWNDFLSRWSSCAARTSSPSSSGCRSLSDRQRQPAGDRDGRLGAGQHPDRDHVRRAAAPLHRRAHRRQRQVIHR